MTDTAVLTFRNVALSFVTMDGLTLMLSCIIDVKLQKNNLKVRRRRMLSATYGQKEEHR